MNPHRQRLLLASTVKCNLPGVAEAKAKPRGKAKAKCKAKAKAKAKAAPQAKAKGKPSTAYGRAQQEFLEELLVLNYRFTELLVCAGS